MAKPLRRLTLDDLRIRSKAVQESKALARTQNTDNRRVSLLTAEFGGLLSTDLFFERLVRDNENCRNGGSRREIEEQRTQQTKNYEKKKSFNTLPSATIEAQRRKSMRIARKMNVESRSGQRKSVSSAYLRALVLDSQNQ